jgi:hypothetical protein
MKGKKAGLLIALFILASLCCSFFTCGRACAGDDRGSFIKEDTAKKVIQMLGDGISGEEMSRIDRCVRNCALLWRSEDGDADAFVAFCKAQYIKDPSVRSEYRRRCAKNFELVSGHFTEMERGLTEPLQLDIGPILPIDYLFGEYSPSSHTSDDLYTSKVAFAVALNFPVYTLKEMLEKGASWSRDQWADARLGQHFDARVPAEVNQKVSSAYNKGDNYISAYYIYMHNLLDEKGNRLFPEGLRLISHWGLRDELKAQYRNKDGFPRQKMIVKVMERIINQEIPKEVINSDRYDWNPYTNTIWQNGKEQKGTPEAGARYVILKGIFDAERLKDPYYPAYPTHIKRSFELGREMPEEEVEAQLVSVMSAPEIRKAARIIEKRLGRKLTPLDVWYDGFRSTTSIPEAELDRIVSARYPDVASLQRDLPAILGKLGFSADKARFLASKITVDPSRGAGHALGAEIRDDNAHLRTRFQKNGLNYKGYNIALHEFGHTVEQVFSLNCVDTTLLSGVPNTAFTEAFAFLFQARDLEVLGVEKPDPMKKHYRVLDTLWDTYELAGDALMDMRVWRWMYAHPDASPAPLQEAVKSIAKDIWNSYYADVFGEKDVYLFAIYSHMIDSGLYLPNYPIGHIIEYQIGDYVGDKNLGAEMERMCTIGSVTPDQWMRKAVGGPVSAKPMLQAADRAIKALEAGGR